MVFDFTALEEEEKEEDEEEPFREASSLGACTSNPLAALLLITVKVALFVMAPLLAARLAAFRKAMAKNPTWMCTT